MNKVDFIIIISMIIIFFTGFIFINNISVIINPYEFDDNEHSQHKQAISNNKNALIFGNISINKDITSLLIKHNISNIVIHDINQLEKSRSYDYLIAISESDFDNIMICSIGKKMMGIENIIAVCNISYYKKIYKDNCINYLSNDNISAALIVSALLSHQKM